MSFRSLKLIEVDHYEEIASALISILQANLTEEAYVVRPLIWEVSAWLRTLIANGYDTWEALREYSRSVHRLHLDISIVIENKNNWKFEIVIFEIKKTRTIWLTELSQLIWYCLVSKSEFWILVNVDNSISSEFSIILNADKDLTEIKRIIDDEVYIHKFWVMVWDSTTKSFNYLDTNMAIKTLSGLAKLIQSAVW